MQHRLVGVSFDVSFEILGPLESFAAKAALVWLEWHVNTDM
jgi:hypothetical protein